MSAYLNCFSMKRCNRKKGKPRGQKLRFKCVLKRHLKMSGVATGRNRPWTDINGELWCKTRVPEWKRADEVTTKGAHKKTLCSGPR